MNISLQTLRQAVTPLFHENVFGINPSVTLGVMAAANTVFLFMVDSTIKRHFIDETKPRTYTKIFLTESLFAGSCAAFNYLLSKVLQVQLSVVSFAIITATAVSFHLLLNRLFGGQKAQAAVATPKKPTAEVQQLNTQLGTAKKTITELEEKLDATEKEKRRLDETLHEKTGEIGRKAQEIAVLRGENDKRSAAYSSALETTRELMDSIKQTEANKKEAESRLANAEKANKVLNLQITEGDPQQTAALDLVKQELAAAQQAVIAFQGERDSLSIELKTSQEQCQRFEASLKKIEEELRTKQTEVGKVREELRQKNHKLEMALKDLDRQKQMTDRAVSERRGRENQVGELQSKISELEEQLEAVREQFSSLAPPPLPPYTEPEAADDSTTASSPGQSTSSQSIIEASETRSLVNTLSSLGGLGLGDDDGDGYEYEEGYEEGYEQEQPSVQLATPQHASTQSAAVAKKSPELPRILEEMKEFETNFLASLKKCQQQRGLPQRKDADPVNDAAVWQIIKKMIVVSTEFLESTKQHGAQATFLNSDLIDRYFLAIEEMINSPEPEKTLAFQRAARQDLLLKRLAKSDDSVSAMSQWVSERLVGFNEVERAREIKTQMDDLTQKLGQLRTREEKKEKLELRICEFGKTAEYTIYETKVRLKKLESKVITLPPKTGPNKGETPIKATLTRDHKEVLEKILAFLDCLPADNAVDRLHCLNQLEKSNWWNSCVKKKDPLHTTLQKLKAKK